jgi:hypothetical protein
MENSIPTECIFNKTYISVIGIHQISATFAHWLWQEFEQK